MIVWRKEPPPKKENGCVLHPFFFFLLVAYFVFAIEAFAFSATASAVNPKWGNSTPAGADAPKEYIATISPQSPAYLYQL